MPSSIRSDLGDSNADTSNGAAGAWMALPGSAGSADAATPDVTEPADATEHLSAQNGPTRGLVVSPGKRSVRGNHGMVVSVNADATRIGAEVLRSGGNAADAAIAVALGLAVTHPSAGNLGGGGFALVRSPDGAIHALDFRESSPALLSRERFKAMVRTGGEGVDSVGVPGTVAGLFELSTRFGRQPFAQVVDPAKRLATEGHIVTQREATAIRVAWSKLKLNPLARRRYGDGSNLPKRAGQRILLPELALTLSRIEAEGRAGYYEGDVAASIVATLGPESQIQPSDLSNYRAIWRTPLTIPYRGLRVSMMPPPSAGGVALATSLVLLATYEPTHLKPGSPKHAHLLLEIMRRAQADRLYEVVDPDVYSSAEQARLQAELLAPERWKQRCPIDPERATPNQRVVEQVLPSLEAEHTTHIAVVDADGMAVSLTTTLSSGFGSKLITDTGIVLNNALGSFSGLGRNQPLPNRRTTSSMAPTIIEDSRGLRLVLGTPGGDTIPSTLLQLINAIVDYSVPLDEAIDAPRLHQSIAPKGDARFESHRPIPLALQRSLQGLGHRFTNSTGAMGHANTIAIVDGVSFGYVDPREGGLAEGPPTD